jgi:hypothetical protein
MGSEGEGHPLDPGQGNLFQCLSDSRQVAIASRLCIPASVQKMNADSFPDCRFSVIEFGSMNPYFAKQGDFVIKVTDHRLTAYTGTASEVAIPGEIATIGQSSFAHCSSIRSVIFGQCSSLSSICSWALAQCQSLESISLPSRVKSLGESCFVDCSRLQTVSFCAGHLLDHIPAGRSTAVSRSNRSSFRRLSQFWDGALSVLIRPWSGRHCQSSLLLFELKNSRSRIVCD